MNGLTGGGNMENITIDRTGLNRKAACAKASYEALESAALSKVDFNALSDKKPMGYYYLKIAAVGNCWDEKEESISQTLASVFSGLHSVKVPFSMLVRGNGAFVDIYYGFQLNHGSEDEILQGLLQASLPLVEIEKNPDGGLLCLRDIVHDGELPCGGFIKGNPSAKGKKCALDMLINGMQNKQWCFAVHARPVERELTVYRQNIFMREATMISELLDVSFSGTNNDENTSAKKTYHEAKKYNEKLEGFCEKYAEALSVGEWEVTVQYAAQRKGDADLLAGLIVSQFYGENSAPETLRHICCENYKLTDCVVSDVNSNIIAEFDYPMISNYLTSNELAIYASLPTVDTAGFAVKTHVDFDVARNKTGTLSLGRILKNGTVTESEYAIDYNELNRHCLIVGLTGSGKTNTTKNILHNVHVGTNGSLPIMVIEPAKKEYWELYKLGFDDLQIYTVGSSDPLCNPYCLNPFERVGNVALQTHIDNVYAAFKASFIMYTPMPYVLERAIYEIYEDYGWDLKTNTNTKGITLYPTIEDLYWKIPVVVKAMGYDAKMRNDLIGSLQARINSLRLGAKGDTLNVRKSFPIEQILKKNVVIELEDIGDDDVKAFIISMLLIQLVELRRQEADSQRSVKHLLLIEEAHRLLKNVSSGTGENADPRGAAVEFFCNLLAELRSKGQGFLIADQIPSKLAPDLIKNTNIKIVHRTVDREDRELMGGAMHMTEEQTDYLSSLKMGESAIYSEGDNRPKLMKPPFAGEYIIADRKQLNEERSVLIYTQGNCIRTENDPMYTSLTNRSEVCRNCSIACIKKPESILSRIDVQLLETTLKRDSIVENGFVKAETLVAKFDEILSGAGIMGEAERRGAAGCMLHHMLKVWKFEEKINTSIIENLFIEWDRRR